MGGEKQFHGWRRNKNSWVQENEKKLMGGGEKSSAGEKKISGAGDRKKTSWVEGKNQVLERKKKLRCRITKKKIMGGGKKSSAGGKKKLFFESKVNG